MAVFEFPPLETYDNEFWQDGARSFRDVGIAIAVGAFAIGTEVSGAAAETTTTYATVLGVTLAGISSVIQKTIQRHP